LNYTAQNNANDYYNDRIDKNKTTPKVFDIMHKYLPDWSNYDWLNNAILLVTIIPLVYQNDKNLYFDFVSLIIIINIIRDIIINITILPKDKNCDLKKYSFMYSTAFGACYDKIFSGHFAFVFILTLLYNSYSIITNMPMIILWNIFNAVSILLIRSHYTIDIIISVFISLGVFNEYMKNHYSFDEVLNILNKN
jgi:hypothetical protein